MASQGPCPETAMQPPNRLELPTSSGLASHRNQERRRAALSTRAGAGAVGSCSCVWLGVPPGAWQHPDRTFWTHRTDMTLEYQVEGLVRDNRVEVRVLFGAYVKAPLSGAFSFLIRCARAGPIRRGNAPWQQEMRGGKSTGAAGDGVYRYRTRSGVRWRFMFRRADGRLSSRLQADCRLATTLTARRLPRPATLLRTPRWVGRSYVRLFATAAD